MSSLSSPSFMQVYRDDSAPGACPAGKQPQTAPAQELHLVWREAAPDGATLWEPQPPPGFKALGALASPSASPPSAGSVLCAAEGGVREAALFDRGAVARAGGGAASTGARPACLGVPAAAAVPAVEPGGAPHLASRLAPGPALLALLAALVRPPCCGKSSS